MPQQFNVVRCSECQMAQANPVKKSSTWNCKVCNAKQPFVETEVVFSGEARMCRGAVQALNLQKGMEDQQRQAVENRRDLARTPEEPLSDSRTLQPERKKRRSDDDE